MSGDFLQTPLKGMEAEGWKHGESPWLHCRAERRFDEAVTVKE